MHDKVFAPSAQPARMISQAPPERGLRRLDIIILLVCALGLASDVGEMTLNGALSAVFSTPPHPAPRAALAALLSATYVGGMIGAPVFGHLSDRMGRRPVLIGVLALFGAAGFLAALSHGLLPLTLLRGLSGLGLGAYPPVVFAYLTDLLPARRRGSLLLGLSGLATLGGPAAIFLARWLTPLHPLNIEGWRWSLLFVGSAALVTATAFLALPEAPAWLLARGQTARARSVALRLARSPALQRAKPRQADPPQSFERDHPAPAPPVSSRDRAVLSVLYFLSPWATVAFPILSGAVLIQKGVNLNDALFFVGASTFGPPLASLLIAPLIDRFERRLILAVCGAGMLVAGSAFVAGAGAPMLTTSSIAVGVLVSIYIATLTTYGAELQPTASRGLATSGLWALNRLGSCLAPFLLLPLLYARGPLAMFAVIAAALLGGLGLLWLAPPGRSGRVVA